jgi:hypothetical protein
MLLSHHQNAAQNHDIKKANRLFCKCCTVQIYGKHRNKSKFDLMRKLKADLILVTIPVIGSEPFSLIWCLKTKKFKTTENYDLACGSVWV